ncbi:MAG TPA: CHRD domain-containing protein [Telluria sp.]|nr:CHRD domain-containing protein [Telluria sp.]
MKTSKKDVRVLWLAATAALLLATGCQSMKAKDPAATAPDKPTATAINPTPMPAATPAPMMSAMMLTGAQEVPANPSTASGKSTIMIGADHSVTGTVQVMGMTPTMAHIHEAVKGSNGPVIVPFVKMGENTFGPAPGAKLTDAQYESYKAGKLYINVHSATYPGGEIRMQMWPAK